MKMVKERTRAMSAVNDESRQLLPSKVIWDGTIDRFEVFRNNVGDHDRQIGSGYLFDSSFQKAYLERGMLTVMLIFWMKYLLLPIWRIKFKCKIHAAHMKNQTHKHQLKLQYHPQIDDSPLCTEDDSAKYR
jgi:hypothetical protein